MEEVMAGSTLGTIFRISTWGESHGKGLGVVVDGCPAGLALNEDILQTYLDRRKPGQTKYSTPRKEGDICEILSGVFEGKTTGTPISIMVKNENQRSHDYSEIASYYRPGHADYTYDSKFGFRDYRGGGRSSGRETIGRVAAGAVACELLKSLGITFTTYTKSISHISCSKDTSLTKEAIMSSPLYMPDKTASDKAEDYLLQCIQNNDSAGGIIECIVSGMPAGIGDPVFERLDANLAKAIMSIGAVKGFEIGDGFDVANALGSSNNDEFYLDEKQNTKKRTNHAGGILGGISDGSDIILRAAIKPTPSISHAQHTISKQGEEININIKGRHDPIIVPRAVVVVEAMTAITICDALLLNMSSKLKLVQDFYRKSTKIKEY